MRKRTENLELPIAQQEIMSELDQDIEAQPAVSASSDTMLRVEHLKMYFPVTKGLLKRRVGDVKAVDDVSFQIKKGQTLGVVGESGSGKSTVGNCIMRNYNITDGSILFDDKDISHYTSAQLKSLRTDLQMITQDPFASLDPRMRVRDIIREGPLIHRMGSKAEQQELVERMLILVGLNPQFADRYPHEFSGGQRQRISIARALALNPSMIVCDEIVSALDVSIQAQIVGLMMKLQEELGLTYFFIGHDLSVVRHLSNQVAVMYLGQFMELTDSDELYRAPLHPYTQALISAAPIPNPTVDRARSRILLGGEIPSPINPPKGCNFCTRCKYADRQCQEEKPEFKDVGNAHFVACHKVTGA